MKKAFTVIALSLAVAGSAQTVKKWQGASSEVWDYVTPNWLPLEGLPLPTVFAEGENALFDDSRYEKEGEDKVVINGTLNLGGIEVNNSDQKPYFFEAGEAAQFAGAGTLLKQGEGELITNVVNNLEGGTLVRQGMLTSPKVDDPNVFGSKVRLEGGTIQLSTSASGSTSYNMNADIEVPEGESGTVIAHRYSQFVNSLTGGGTLHFVSRGERAFVRLDSEDTNWKDFTGKIVVSGDTRFNPGYTGLGLRTGKTWNAGDFLGKDSTFADNVIVLENGGALYSESGERCYVIGELQGDESSVIHGYMRSSTTPGIYWMVGGLNTDVDFAGKIQPVATTNITVGGETVSIPRRDNRVGIIKVGSGTYKFTNGENYITGGIDVVEGKVLISNAEGSRSGTGHSSSYETVIWVREGAALGGSGRISGSVEVEGLIEPGDEGIGVLTVKDFDASLIEDGKEPKPFTVFLRSTSTLAFELGSVGASDLLVSDSIKVEGGILELRLADSYQLSPGDVVQLWDAELAEGSVAFSEVRLPMVEEGWEWDTTELMSSGVVKLVAGGGEYTSYRSPVTNDFILAPNPSSGSFTVRVPSGDGFTVEVYNGLGQMVQQRRVNGQEALIQLSGERAGLYIVRVLTADGWVTKKLVVQ